jgi:formylglycine-generating enzyme required for sulfatase activity
MKQPEYSLWVIRGGAWSIDAEYCRSAFRDYWRDPGLRDINLGFRLARTCPRPLDDLTAIAKSEDSQ